jgi:hypothetical protein
MVISSPCLHDEGSDRQKRNNDRYDICGKRYDTFSGSSYSRRRRRRRLTMMNDDKRHWLLGWASIRLLSGLYDESLDWGDLDYFVAEDSHNRMHRLPLIDQRFRSITVSKLTDPETERARSLQLVNHLQSL